MYFRFFKAFDTVNHPIILLKIEIYGITEKALNVLKVILRIESSIFKLTRKIKQNFYQLHVAFHKIQYWDHFCFDFILMTCQTPQRFLIQ